MQNQDAPQYRFEGQKDINQAFAYIKKANNRLAKAGIEERFEAVNLSEGEVEIKKGIPPFQTTQVVDFVEFDLNVPKIGHDGWTFVASVSFEDGGTLVNAVPGQDLTDWIRPEQHLCEHCGYKRERTKSYVLRNDESGEYMQIGSSCVVLFLGVSPALWAVGFELPAPSGEISDNVPMTFGRDIWIAISLAVTDNGKSFVSRANAVKWEKAATSNDVMNVYSPNPRAGWQEKAWVAEMQDKAQTILAEEPELIAEVIAAGHRVGQESDYGMNLAVVLGSENVSHRGLGILTSVVGVYNREQVREAERKANPQVQGFLGEVKERLRDLKVTVTGVKYLEGMYGTTTLLSFRTAEGRVAKWFASGYKEFELGAELVIDGTVKALEEFNGQDQTMLTRVAVKA